MTGRRFVELAAVQGYISHERAILEDIFFSLKLDGPHDEPPLLRFRRQALERLESTLRGADAVAVPDDPSLRKLLAMTRSDHDGEALSALRAVQRRLAASGMRIEDLLPDADAVSNAAPRRDDGPQP